MKSIPQGRVGRQPESVLDAVEMALFTADYPPTSWAVLVWGDGVPEEHSRHDNRDAALAAARALLPADVSIEDADLWDATR
ncbi:hypothetical protein EEQ64_22385 [Escherichia coli]|nr:hypothetical protein [Escherichia coli]EFA5127531.1 hypothetical protein [Escherichia coli]